tara:strand:+ start:2515 stop:3141 length:627 start_codon:yes stop_codon:yes gene_type:complete
MANAFYYDDQIVNTAIVDAIKPDSDIMPLRTIGTFEKNEYPWLAEDKVCVEYVDPNHQDKVVAQYLLEKVPEAIRKYGEYKEAKKRDKKEDKMFVACTAKVAEVRGNMFGVINIKNPQKQHLHHPNARNSGGKAVGEKTEQPKWSEHKRQMEMKTLDALKRIEEKNDRDHAKELDELKRLEEKIDRVEEKIDRVQDFNLRLAKELGMK